MKSCRIGALVVIATFLHCLVQLVIHILAGVGFVGADLEWSLSPAMAIACTSINFWIAIAVVGEVRKRLVYFALAGGAVLIHTAIFINGSDLFLLGFQFGGFNELSRIEQRIETLAKENGACLVEKNCHDRNFMLMPLIKDIRHRPFFGEWCGAWGRSPRDISYIIVFHKWNRIWGAGFGCPQAFGRRLSEMSIRVLDADHFVFVGPYHDQSI